MNFIDLSSSGYEGIYYQPYSAVYDKNFVFEEESEDEADSTDLGEFDISESELPFIELPGKEHFEC